MKHSIETKLETKLKATTIAELTEELEVEK